MFVRRLEVLLGRLLTGKVICPEDVDTLKGTLLKINII